MDVREVRAGRGPGALAREAVAEGVEVLAVAGGDGTVSAVAAVAVAVARNVPLMVLPCGIRNHFAMDCGASVKDPARELVNITNGHEVPVDVGAVNGHVFLNNVSVGFYAAMVRDPEYRVAGCA